MWCLLWTCCEFSNVKEKYWWNWFVFRKVQMHSLAASPCEVHPRKSQNCARIISAKCSSIALYQGWLAESFTWLSCDYHVYCDYLQSRFRSYVPPSPHALLRITLNINSNLNTPPLSLHEHLQWWFVLTTQKSALVVQSIIKSNVHSAGDLCADSHSTTSR